MESNHYSLSDEELVRLLREDDRRAFSILYERYWERLFRAAYNVLVNQDAAKDIVQEIFLNIWRKRFDQQISACGAYLHQAVKFQVAKRLKDPKFIDIHAIQFDLLHNVNPVEESINLKDIDQVLEETLKRLPDKCRDAFYMSRFEHLSNREIAERLELSPRTVEWHISNALKSLRHSLQELSVFLPLICFC